MTALWHNERRDLLDGALHPTVGVAIDACLAADGADRVLVSVRLDGREIAPEELAELRELATEGIDRLEVVSRERGHVARDALESAAGYAPGLASTVARAASLLRAGELTRAQDLWADSCEALDVLVHALAAVGAALPAVEGALAEIGDGLVTPLPAVLDAHTRGDWLGLADLLEYELAVRIAASAARLAALRGAAAGAAEA